MQEKTFQIPFNSDLFISTHKKLWTFTNRLAVKRNIYYTVIALLCLAFNLYAAAKDDLIGNAVCGGFLFYMIITWANYIERWLKFNKTIKANKLKFEQENMTCTYILNEDYIFYKDKEKELKLSWHLFKPFEAYKGTIYIKLKAQNSAMFSVSVEELGDEAYDDFYNILLQKLQ